MKCHECGQLMRKVKENYHFTECGLDYVYLSGIPIFKCACGATTAKIPNMKDLLNTIGEAIVNKPTRLTGFEVRYLRKNVGLSATAFARYLAIDPATLSRWERNKRVIGKTSDLLVRLCYAVLMEYEHAQRIMEIFISLREKAGRKIEVKPSSRKGYEAAYVSH